MSTQELKAGKQWVERRFAEIAREFGAPRALVQEDRWREDHTPREHTHSMAYYIELRGHLKRGKVTFEYRDLEICWRAGEPAAREKLGRHIRDALVSSSGGMSSAAMSPARANPHSTPLLKRPRESTG